MNKVIVVIVSGLVLFAVGVGIGRYITPVKTITVVDTKKETDKETTDIVKHNADGSTETQHIVKDVTKNETETTKLVDNKKPDWKATLLAGYSFDDYNKVYGLDVQRRILGSVFVGIWGTSQKTIGLSVGYEF